HSYLTTRMPSLHCFSYLPFYSCAHHRNLHSFPTRRSSDLMQYLLVFRQRMPNRQKTESIIKNAGAVPAFFLFNTQNPPFHHGGRSEEHTSELQSRENLVCRLPLEKKNINHDTSAVTDSQ